MSCAACTATRRHLSIGLAKHQLHGAHHQPCQPCLLSPSGWVLRSACCSLPRCNMCPRDLHPPVTCELERLRVAFQDAARYRPCTNHCNG